MNSENKWPNGTFLESKIVELAKKYHKIAPNSIPNSWVSKIPLVAWEYSCNLSEAYTEREHAKFLYETCSNARDLLNSMNKLTIDGFLHVMPEWDSDEKILKWLENLSKQCTPLSRHIEMLPSKHGATGRTRDAEMILLKSVADLLPTTLQELDRAPLVRKIAIDIHEIVTGKKELQKFRKLQRTV